MKNARLRPRVSREAVKAPVAGCATRSRKGESRRRLRDRAPLYGPSALAGSQSDPMVEKGKKPFRSGWFAVALLIGVGTLAYSNSFDGVFVFDD